MESPSSRGRARQRGQSIPEFALVLPVLLLLTLFGLDFGRVFLGWVTLNNVAREAANFAAENPKAWSTVNPDTVAQAEYARLVAADSVGINCALPSPIPAPSLPDGPDGVNGIGLPVKVTITCSFGLITPLVGDLIGSSIPVTASAAFPIRQGVIAGIPVASAAPTPTPSPSPTPAPSGDPTPSPTPTPTPDPMCTVPDLTKVKAIKAQATWSGAGFALPVLFNPAFPAQPPNGGGNVTSQTVAPGTSAPCLSTAITVTWR